MKRVKKTISLPNNKIETKKSCNLSDSEVWLKAWCSVANAFNCESIEAATRWADGALKDYKQRFDSQVVS
jgi:hypothetical protein